ncbi:alginate O-acetyltransferase AlgX-related protein [Pontibacter harenae]|uniref:alginate O-acetyltransferase AlgX-related protein n=1 Tax=Pontibacter harenae TaxID=2894083 RepID=UPI001E595987|nr:hypothetical protein [Pontibacter harenae]MCC9166764.1 hypothetical protein [Pontibacter harenae]
MNFFTFRIWETISVNTMKVMPGPFYPNIYMKMEEEGELAPRTQFSEKRLVEWYTDEYGYRNRDSKCDVLLIGDSNITGAKLTQDETMAEVLERMLQKDVYSFAPATMNRFLATERFQEDPPEVVVVSSIERRVPELPAVGANGINSKLRNITGTIIGSSQILTSFAVTADRVSKLGLYRRTLANIDRNLGNRDYIVYNNELFMEGEYANREYSEEEIMRISDVLEGYKNALDERGIRFLFMPIPNKENVYYKMLPSQKEATFLPRLFAELEKRNIPYLDTQSTFRQLHEQKNMALYPRDDAHWNEKAVEAAASLLANELQPQHSKKSEKKHFVNLTK